MKDPLLSLASDELRQLASALEAGRLTPPYSAVGLQRFVGHTIAADVADSLSEIAADGCGPAALARFIRLLAAESDQHPRLEDVVQLVATGPTELDNAPRRVYRLAYRPIKCSHKLLRPCKIEIGRASCRERV